jgi:isoleucyl-tRNA synthetase
MNDDGMRALLPIEMILGVHDLSVDDDAREFLRSLANAVEHRYPRARVPLLPLPAVVLVILVVDVARKLSMVWNMYDFFTMYAEVDGWEWNGTHEDPAKLCTNPLDTWIISRVHQLTQEVEKHMEGYDLPNAMKPILPFIDDASNWYVRRSRRRFWKSDATEDKQNAYKTLHYVLVQLSMVLAPFVPFLSEELYQKLTGGESVHLLDWPKVGHLDDLLLEEMAEVRRYVNEALAVRAKEGVKVRQPLQSVTIPHAGKIVDFTDILTEELNVKEVFVVQDAELSLDLKISPQLHREGLMREVIRQVQNARKQAGLNVDDRIVLTLQTGSTELADAVTEHTDTILQEVLATQLRIDSGDVPADSAVRIESHTLGIHLRKAEL